MERNGYSGVKKVRTKPWPLGEVHYEYPTGYKGYPIVEVPDQEGDGCTYLVQPLKSMIVTETRADTVERIDLQLSYSDADGAFAKFTAMIQDKDIAWHSTGRNKGYLYLTAGNSGSKNRFW